MNRAKVLHRRSVDVEAAADIERRHVGPRSHDVLQAQVCQLPAIPEVEPLYQRTPAQQRFDGRVSDVETCREVNALATTRYSFVKSPRGNGRRERLGVQGSGKAHKDACVAYITS